ncbi:peptide chain release factor H [Leptospira interrogans]
MIRLLLTSGRGPVECRIALSKVLAILERDAEAAGLDLDVAAGPDPDGHGPASAVAIVDGSGAREFAASWTGSILWVAQSPVRLHHKRKNWYIGVLKLNAPIARPDHLNPADVRFDTFRAGGPGGQHQNRTESAVRAVHVPTGLSVIARDGRSQHRNKAIALERLAALLKLHGDLSAITDRENIQSGHDQVERGRPVRRFRGPRFVPG